MRRGARGRILSSLHMLRLVLIAIGIACVLVLVGLPLLAVWLAHHDDAFLEPGDID